jgi:hypothetical protein
VFRWFLNGQNCSVNKEKLETTDGLFRGDAAEDGSGDNCTLPEGKWREPRDKWTRADNRLFCLLVVL